MWHIAKRELYDNLNSLRFALATVLLLGLMLTNAVVHLREHPVRMQKYHDAVTRSLNGLKSRTDLYEIAQWGPGGLYKKPSPLHFCAEGGDIFLSDHVHGGFVFWTTDDLKRFLAAVISTRDAQFKKYPSRHYQSGLDICDRVRLESHRNPVHLRFDFQRARARYITFNFGEPSSAPHCTDWQIFRSIDKY